MMAMMRGLDRRQAKWRSRTLAKALRTPSERFHGLEGYPYRPNYIYDLPGFENLRMHYLDEGYRAAQHVFLCLHGQPTWSYLYRRMIPIFLNAGHRVIAPDLYGFGKSDKPVNESTYTFEFHRNSLLRLIERLDLHSITLVCQDWGGLLGLSLSIAPTMAGRFTRLIVMNTMIATGDVPLGKGFLAWRAYNSSQHDLNIAALLKRACPHLTQAEADAYNAPYPDARYKAGVRKFPLLVPEKPDDPGAAIGCEAREWWRKHWTGSTFMAVGVQDPVLGAPAMRTLRSYIKGCPEPLMLPTAGHFVQEWGEQVAAEALNQFDVSPGKRRIRRSAL